MRGSGRHGFLDLCRNATTHHGYVVNYYYYYYEYDYYEYYYYEYDYYYYYYS